MPLALLGTPIPSDDDQEKVRPDVEELTKADYEALRAGVESHGALAAALANYASQPDVDPAARYLLLRASFRQYLQGEDVSAAERAYDAALKEHGLAYALEIARFSASMLNRCATSHVLGAKEFQSRLAVDDRRAKTVESLRLQAIEMPDDAVLHGRLAVALVEVGDWSSALDEYAKSSVEAAETVRFENLYPRTGLTNRTTADVAEFWWRESEAATNAFEAAQMFRRRAVKWYGHAITNGVLRGVKRQIAEKRIAAFGGGRPQESTSDDEETLP